MVFTNIRPIWMVSQEARDVGSRWMSPTLSVAQQGFFLLFVALASTAFTLWTWYVDQLFKKKRY